MPSILQLRSRLHLELDQNNEIEAVKLAIEFKTKFFVDFLEDVENHIDLKKLVTKTPNFVNGYYVLTE